MYLMVGLRFPRGPPGGAWNIRETHSRGNRRPHSGSPQSRDLTLHQGGGVVALDAAPGEPAVAATAGRHLQVIIIFAQWKIYRER